MLGIEHTEVVRIVTIPCSVNTFKKCFQSAWYKMMFFDSFCAEGNSVFFCCECSELKKVQHLVNSSIIIKIWSKY